MEMCAAFAELGHSVTLFAKRGKLEDEDPHYFYGVKPGFQLRCRPKMKNALGGILFGWRLWQWVLKWQVAHLRANLIYARNAKALRVVNSLGTPFVFEAHVLPHVPEEQAWMFGQPNFQRLVVISKVLKNDYLAQFPSLQEAKILVAHDGAPNVVPTATNTEPNPNRLRVGYIGHLYPGKGMEIISKLPQRCPWADIHVFGGREEDLEVWKLKLNRYANISLHGFIPHRETPTQLATFDVVLAPYQTRVTVHGGSDTAARWMSPLKIFEYMSHGKPIIASDLPVLREVLESEINALLVPPSDVDAWVAALSRVREDIGLRHRLGKQARRDFEAHYTWKSRAKSVLSGLSDVH
jgi:glycosyltransferase involved in cell wall biosynthesis